MLTPNVLQGWSRGKVQEGDPKRPKETMPPGGWAYLCSSSPGHLIYRDAEEVAVSEILCLSQDDQHNDSGCVKTVVLTHPLHHIL